MAHITVPDETPSVDFAVTLLQDTFVFDFTYFDQTDLRVTVNGKELQQIEFDTVGDPGFEGGYPGGALTLAVPVENSTVRIWSEVPPARVNDFLEGPGFPARSINTEFDRLWAWARDMRLRLQRTPVLTSLIDRTLTDEDAGQIWTNEGNAASLTYTLPLASSGLEFTFAVVVAFSLVINDSDDDTLYTGSGIGSIIRLRGMDDGTWLVESSTGTWA